MASRKNPEERSEPNVAAAAEKASMVIRGLQARLKQRTKPSEETSEDLERQLAMYFSQNVPTSRRPLLNNLRSRVVDAVAERILRQWEQHAPIESAVIERLIERLLDRFGEPIR